MTDVTKPTDVVEPTDVIASTDVVELGKMLATAGRTPGRPRGRPKGSARVPGSGRRKGTPNKLNAMAAEILASLKCDPLTGMARIAMNKNNPVELRFRAWAELCHYRHPKKKAVEITGDAGQYVLAIQITQESGSSNDG